jgi:hypothetical protein
MFSGTPEFLPGRAGFSLTFENGWEISVQWGPGTYSEYGPRDPETEMLRSRTAEVAIFNSEGEYKTNVVAPEYASSDVAGWLTVEQVGELITRVQRLA